MANFCRRYGANIAEAQLQHVDSLQLAEPGDGTVGGRSSRAVDEHTLVRELYWLCGIPIAVSVVYTIYVRVAGLSAVGSLSVAGAMAIVSIVGALVNIDLARSAVRVPRARHLLATLLVALVAGPSLTAAFWLLNILGFPLHDDYVAPYVQDGWPLWVAFVDLALLTPVAEEVLFRGLIQPKLGQIIRPIEALIVQAALFSAVHLSPVITVTHFAMGLAFGWLRGRSGSVWPGILLHGAWNAWVLVSAP